MCTRVKTSIPSGSIRTKQKRAGSLEHSVTHCFLGTGFGAVKFIVCVHWALPKSVQGKYIGSWTSCLFHSKWAHSTADNRLSTKRRGIYTTAARLNRKHIKRSRKKMKTMKNNWTSHTRYRGRAYLTVRVWQKTCQPLCSSVGGEETCWFSLHRARLAVFAC